MTKPAFRPIARPLDVDDAALNQVADRMGVPVLIKPTATTQIDGKQKAHNPSKQDGRSSSTDQHPSAPAARKSATTSKVRASELEKLTLELPRYLGDAIKLDAIIRHTSARHVVMLALQKAGFEIDAADLVPDGRRARRKSTLP